MATGTLTATATLTAATLTVCPAHPSLPPATLTTIHTARPRATRTATGTGIPTALGWTKIVAVKKSLAQVQGARSCKECFCTSWQTPSAAWAS
uniref:Putative secreted protein n=1 Tax=Ixodes ricinus TaxID=34613 RepID=A0A6B0U845_IXORI